MEIEEKIQNYIDYRNKIDRIIKSICKNEILSEQERCRLVGKLNSARYHCEGRISSLNKYKKEN